jgi:nitroreductase
MPFAPPVTSAVFPSNRIVRRPYTVRPVELREILRSRRMHRAFLPDPLPPEQIERIAHVIRHAPSGGFSPGGSVVVVTDDATRAAIAHAFGDEHYSTNGRNFIADAPVHMVLSANEALYHARYNEPDKLQATGGVEVTWPVPYWFVDAGALMMLVLMTAIDEGLASAFVGHPDQKRIFDELLGLPEEVVPIGLALIGKPGDGPSVGSRLSSRRRPLDDLVHWQRW